MEKKKILVIDNDKDFAELVKVTLEETGKYEVSIETKGSRGLAATRTYMPDLVLLDIIMPDMEGSYVAAQIEDDDIVKNIPIIFLTAVVTGDEDHSEDGVIGRHPFLAKPVSIEDLLSCIEKHI